MESVSRTLAYSPFAPSPLSVLSSSSAAASSPPPPSSMHDGDNDDDAPSSDPMLPSSPTPKSASQRARTRLPSLPQPPAPRSASYKSQLSARRVPPAASSSSSSSSPTPFGLSPTSLSTRTRRAAQENSRAARMQSLKRHSSRDVPLSGPVGADEPGGWVDGEWEEFDDDEKFRLELEMRKAKREFEWRQRRLDDLASEQGFPTEEDEDAEDDNMEMEPPLDVLFDEDDDPPVPSSTGLALPYLASAPSSDHNDYKVANSRRDDDVSSGELPRLPRPSSDDLAAFDRALVTSPFCPACGAANSPLGGDSTVGLRCMGKDGQQGCGWGIEMNVLGPLREAFAAHGSDRQGHRPLLSYTPFTGTIILCAVPGCDEQYGA
ncbi:hypothetical protein JCM3774_002136 [Rhodotorula dairenensis]